jgi:hypothetical protein
LVHPGNFIGSEGDSYVYSRKIVTPSHGYVKAGLAIDARRTQMGNEQTLFGSIKVCSVH